jgi:hypothetical protein
MPLRKILRSMFGLDLRSLALLRMALAGLILWDLALAAGNLRAFYTDEGVVPRSLVSGYHYPPFRLHLLSGAAWFEGLLFAAEAACAVALLLGWRTRIAAVLCFVLLVSRQTRNELVLFGPDLVLRIILFWAVFLPLGARWSLDAARKKLPHPAPAGGRWLGVAGLCYLVQFSLVYVINGLMKTGPAWHADHTAVARALTLEIYSRPPGVWLNQFDGVTTALTHVTLWLEVWGCLLLVLPVLNGWGRLLGCVLLGALQVGFNVTMDLGLFGPVMIGTMLGLLPAEFWDRCVAPFARRLLPAWDARALAPEAASTLPPPAAMTRKWPAAVIALVRDTALLYLLALVVAANVNGLPQRAGRAPLTLPGGLPLMVAVGLDQRFDMFAPDPQADDGWFVMRGTLANGGTADVFSGARPATLGKPPSVVGSYRGQRWGAVLIAVGYPGSDSYLQTLAEYLGREWNRTHPAEERLTMLEIIVMSQYVDHPHHLTEPEEVLLWTEYF